MIERLKSTNKRTIKLMRKMLEQFKTITSDNGTEFDQYKVVEQATRCPYYHSLERGTNDNTNDFIRQYLVTRTSMKRLTEHNAIAAKLNARPRKKLACKTPEGCFYK